MKRYNVAILGATGAVGREMYKVLMEREFPIGELKLLASARSAGKVLDGRTVEEATEASFRGMDIVLGAASNDLAKRMAPHIKAAGAVFVDNSSAFRLCDDVPLVVPEINPEHFDVIEFQKKRLGTKRGFIAVKPNCSIQSYAPVLTAWKEFEPYEVVATTYQAISGAGKTFKDWPERVENIIPYIGGEEEKSEKEPLRIWGKVEDGVIKPATEPVITCQCIRVPVLNGHTAAVFVKFRKNPTKEQLIKALVEFKGLPQELELPSAPKQFIHYFQEDDRPQAKLDRNIEGGMAVSVGRLREDTMFDYKFVCLSHNTLRGAAGGSSLSSCFRYSRRPPAPAGTVGSPVALWAGRSDPPAPPLPAPAR